MASQNAAGMARPNHTQAGQKYGLFPAIQIQSTSRLTIPETLIHTRQAVCQPARRQAARSGLFLPTLLTIDVRAGQLTGDNPRAKLGSHPHRGTRTSFLAS